MSSGMMTKIWGPPGWVFLHSITMGYPQEIDENNEEHILRREGMISLFESLQYVFPCSYCRKSYAKFIEEKPIREHVNNRETLVLWFYNIHNNVNKSNNKDILSYEDVKKIYLNSYNYSIEKDESVESNITFMLAIILVILIIYYFLKK